MEDIELAIVRCIKLQLVAVQDADAVEKCIVEGMLRVDFLLPFDLIELKLVKFKKAHPVKPQTSLVETEDTLQSH